MGRLDGKVAVITGGSRGIGEAIALAYAREGAKVAVLSRKPEGVAAAAERINQIVPNSALGVPCHVGTESSIEAAFDEVERALGTPRILVNNAGTNPYFGPMLGVQESAWDKTFDVNLKGPFWCARSFAHRRFATGDTAGSIICISSVMGQRAAPFQGVYGMTKAALISLVKTMALELADANIRVNAIAPGFVSTKLAAAIESDPEVKKQVLAHTPMKRVARPEEIAGCAVYLASEESSFTTGQTFNIDGGYTIV